MSITVLWLMYDDVALLPVDQFAADDPLPPKGRQEEENPHQDARQFMHRPAPPVEGIADNQRKGRQNHSKRAQKHQAKVSTKHLTDTIIVLLQHLQNRLSEPAAAGRGHKSGPPRISASGRDQAKGASG